ncbi:putative Myb/SANT-like domain-containing protein [Helianthus annuus]|nr:putative Myb/SANT-like domain-containing protein [Helianthus annuus]
MAKRIRINWKQEGVEKTFLEACVHEITVNGREGSSLKQASWKTVAENLKTQHNFIVEQRQMKNHYDFLKGKFAAWLKLKNKTGTLWIWTMRLYAYGVLKARFPILKQMAPFSFPIQRDIVIACFAVHNFIRKCNIYDQLFMDYDENTMFHEMQSGENDGLLVQDIEWGSQGIDYMTSLRNQIANQLLSNESN